jgi:outer membrane protein
MAAGTALAVVPAWAEPKIGVVDPQRLLLESPQGKAMADAMQAEFAPRQRTLQAQQQSIKTKEDKLQKDGATMSEDQRLRAEKELRDSARDFERAKGEFQDDVTARRNEEMSRLQRTLGEGCATTPRRRTTTSSSAGRASSLPRRRTTSRRPS